MAPAMKTYTKAVRRSKCDKAVKYVNEVPRQPEIPKGLLRDVKQDSYPDICALSEKQAKMRIEVALKLRSPLWGRKCYACKFALVGKKLVGAKWFGKRCSNPKCQKMFKRDPHHVNPVVPQSRQQPEQTPHTRNSCTPCTSSG